MALAVEAHEEAGDRLTAGARVKGEYRCKDCGYGVTVYRELPTCPMCRSEQWKQADWNPLGRTTLPYEP
jgi:rubrerythrin